MSPSEAESISDIYEQRTDNNNAPMRFKKEQIKELE
jgi:hypothetical protein